MPTPRLDITTPARLLIVATLHAVAKLFASDESVPTPESGVLYRHGLTRDGLIAQAGNAGTQIKIGAMGAWCDVPLATHLVHGIDLRLTLFCSAIGPDDVQAYGEHNRRISELQDHDA